MRTTSTNAPGASVVTSPPAKSKTTPSARDTVLRSRVSSPMFFSSMNSNSSLSVSPPATGSGGSYISSVTRRSARMPAAIGSPAINCTGVDQWLVRPVLSFTRQRTR